MLKLPCRKVPLNEWEVVPPAVRELVPTWLQVLLSEYALVGPFLERKHEIYEWNRDFGFWTPSDYAEAIDPDDEVIMKGQILDLGLIPISDADDGDLWLVKIKGLPSDPVKLYDLSGMKIKLVNDSFEDFLKTLELSL